MNRNKILLSITLLLTFASNVLAQQIGDTLWVRYDNRFKPNAKVQLKDVDSIVMTMSVLYLYKDGQRSMQNLSTLAPVDKSEMHLLWPGRYLLKPNTYSGTNYENSTATEGYNFAHSLESEHFAVFWDAKYGSDPTRIKHPDDGNVANAYNVLDVAERCWKVYVEELGFIVPGTRYSFIFLTSQPGGPMPLEPTERMLTEKPVLQVSDTSTPGQPMHAEAIP